MPGHFVTGNLYRPRGRTGRFPAVLSPHGHATDGRFNDIGPERVAEEIAPHVEEIDAEGHVVTPGFIDGHTHMDAQVAWDPLGTCSCWHGVTSVVMGNCGVGFAPVHDADHAADLFAKPSRELMGCLLRFALLLGLLPCGPVYTALLAAAGAGMHTENMLQGILKGMGVMFCFGLGTVPTLFLIAKLVDMGWLKNRQIIYRIGTVLMLIVGVYFIYQGITF